MKIIICMMKIENTKIIRALKILNTTPIKIIFILNKRKELVGTITDGDLRRTIKNLTDIHKTPIEKIMNKKFLFCFKNDYATDALAKMKKNKINSMPVLDKNKKIIGAINMHILVNSGI